MRGLMATRGLMAGVGHALLAGGLVMGISKLAVGKAQGFIVWLAVRCAWAYCARVLRPSGLLLSGILGSLCMGRPVRASTWPSSCWPRLVVSGQG